LPSSYILYAYSLPFWYFSISVYYKIFFCVQLEYLIFVTLSIFFYQCDIKFFLVPSSYILYAYSLPFWYFSISVYYKIFFCVQLEYLIFVTLSIFFYQCDIKFFSCAQFIYPIRIFITLLTFFYQCDIKFFLVPSSYILYAYSLPFWHFSISVYYKIFFCAQVVYLIFVTLSIFFLSVYDIKFCLSYPVNILYAYSLPSLIFFYQCVT
jgi:hypothetical protein